MWGIPFLNPERLALVATIVLLGIAAIWYRGEAFEARLEAEKASGKVVACISTLERQTDAVDEWKDAAEAAQAESKEARKSAQAESDKYAKERLVWAQILQGKTPTLADGKKAGCPEARTLIRERAVK